MAMTRLVTFLALLSVIGTFYVIVESEYEVTYRINSVPFAEEPDELQMPFEDEESDVIPEVTQSEFKFVKTKGLEADATTKLATSALSNSAPFVLDEEMQKNEIELEIDVNQGAELQEWVENEVNELSVTSSPSDTATVQKTSTDVDLDWLAERERLLASNGPRKLFLFAYMHGGSTLLFKLFDQDSRTFAWYETLGPLYGHMFGLPGYRLHTWIIKNSSKEHEDHYFPRDVTAFEIMHIKQLFRDMFSCNFESLPGAVFTDGFMGYSRAFRDYSNCYIKVNKPKGIVWNRQCVDSSLNPYCGYKLPRLGPAKPFVVDAKNNGCPEYLEKARVLLANRTQAKITKILEESYFKRKMKAFLDNELCLQNLYESTKECMLKFSLKERCQNSQIQVTKILRLKMPFIEPLIRAIPDMQIVYYLRDPRATAASRLGSTGPQTPLKFVTAVTKLCEEIASDVAAMDELEERYPNVFLRLRYEDLVAEPDKSVGILFKHIALDPTPVAFQWIHDALHGDSNTGVQRTNATYIVNKWRTKYQKAEIDTASYDVKCRNVLQKFGYL